MISLRNAVYLLYFSHMIKESMIQIESILKLFYNQKKWSEHVSRSISPTYKFFCTSLLINIDKNDLGRTNLHLNSTNNTLSFCSENLHFTTLIYSQKMMLSVVNMHFAGLFFPLLFKYLAVFTRAIWKIIKPKFSKEENQKLILVICTIPDPLEKLIKITTKVC